jgi:hypothetical protein
MHGIGHRLSFIVWAVVLSAWITPCLAQGPSMSGAWRQARVNWIKPPELHLNERQGEASTLYFASDHRFMLLYASVIQSPKAETISHGDGQVVFLDTWQMDGGTLRAKFRLVSRTVSPEGEALPGPIQTETISLQKHPLTCGRNVNGFTRVEVEGFRVRLDRERASNDAELRCSHCRNRKKN